jgi:hypothetical protein
MFMINVNAACGIFDGTGCKTFNETVLSFILPTMQAITIGVAIIYLLYGAIMYITSAGEEKATKTATATLTNAAIGMAIALLVVVIIQVLKNALGAGSGTPSVPGGLIPGGSSGSGGGSGGAAPDL